MSAIQDSELSDRSIADLLKQLSDQTAALVRQELDLAKAERAIKGKQAGVGAGMFGGAEMFGVYGAGALTARMVLALATALTWWLAAPVVAAIYGATAAVLALAGMSNVGQGVPAYPNRQSRA